MDQGAATISEPDPSSPVPRRPSRWREARGVILLAALALALPGLGAVGLFEPLRQAAESVRGDAAAWWPVFVALAAMLCGIALLPTHAVSLAAGFLFGPIIGTPTALASAVTASLVGYMLARSLAGARLRPAIDRSHAGRAIAAAMIDARGARAVLAVTLARLPPQMPFALGNVVAATVGVRLTALLLGTAVGMLPRTAAVAWLGGRLATLESTDDLRVLIVGAAAAAVGLIGLGWWAWRILRRAGRR